MSNSKYSGRTNAIAPENPCVSSIDLICSCKTSIAPRGAGLVSRNAKTTLVSLLSGGGTSETLASAFVSGVTNAPRAVNGRAFRSERRASFIA
jgi:hypothetical protein